MSSPRLTGCFIDWLSLSFPPDVKNKTLESILQGLVASEDLEETRGQLGYSSSYRTADRSIRLLLDGGHGEMGPHLTLTGKACEKHQDDMFTLVSKAINLGAKVARVDLSVDDYDGLLDLSEMQRSIKGGGCVSRFRKEARTEEYCRHTTGRVVGQIVRFGSRTSPVSIRFYDKGMQKGKDYHWIRIELELKKKVSQPVVEEWIQGTPLDDLFYGILGTYLSFRDPCKDSNRSRWPVAIWWQSFLNQRERVNFRIRKDSHKEDFEWFVKNYDKVLARVERHYGPEIFQRMAESGKRKISNLG